MAETVLCVDDDPSILDAYQRQLRKHFQIETASSGAQGLDMIAQHGPYAVIVADMRMPGMDGIQFLTKVRDVAPDSVRMMLTGNADQHTAIKAINEGRIFRFLTKPCPPDDLARALTAGIEQYRLITAEKELLEKTLSGTIKVLTDILSVVNPTAFGRAARVRRLAVQLAEELHVEHVWEVEVAAMLSQVGCVTVPEDILMKVYRGMNLSPDESQKFHTHPQVGYNLIAAIPRLEGVAAILAYQEKRFDGSGVPDDDVREEAIPFGARILKLALDFDTQVASGITNAVTLSEIRRREGWYDPAAIEALKRVLAREFRYEHQSVPVDALVPGMVLADDVQTATGVLLLTRGQEITPALRMRLQTIAQTQGLHEPIPVLVPIR
ncbi:MAG: response regulator [Candidatus Latescibacteria bacterium]|nr:response regulator [Candidatus Latescibacterota bacterium]